MTFLKNYISVLGFLLIFLGIPVGFFFFLAEYPTAGAALATLVGIGLVAYEMGEDE